MFERFTERARQVVVLAQDEARALKHNYIGTEHILLGLSRDREGIAGQALSDRGLTYPLLRRQVSLLVDAETSDTSGAGGASGTSGTSGTVGPGSSAEVYDANALKKRLTLIRARLDRIEQHLRADTP